MTRRRREATVGVAPSAGGSRRLAGARARRARGGGHARSSAASNSPATAAGVNARR